MNMKYICEERGQGKFFEIKKNKPKTRTFSSYCDQYVL